jgi:hypothetical protein
MHREGGDRAPLKRAEGASLLEAEIRKAGAVMVILDPQISLTTGAAENSNDDADALFQNSPEWPLATGLASW